MALDLMTLGFGMETKGLERGQRALNDLERQGVRTADALDKTGARGSNALGGMAKSAAAAGAASQNAFASMVSGATGAAGAFSRLQAAALPALAAAFGVTQIFQAADAYTKFTAQLKLATESQVAYNQALQTVQRISSAAQGDIGAVGTLYARIARNTEQLGFSQLKVAAITESVALALKANGASTAEASSAMLQLSQAFGAGVLRGEEFNSIIESAPNLIRAIADSLGVTTGEMRKLAEEGLITSAVMGEALPAALEQFRSEAAQVRTIGGAFTELGNAVTTMIGQVGNSTGVIGGFSGAITGLASIVKESGPAITGLLSGLAAGAVVAGMGALAVNIGLVSGAVKGLAVSMLALAANPVVLAILGIGAVVGGIAYLGARKEALEGNATAIQKLGEKTEQLAGIESRLSKLRNENGELKAGVNRLAVIDDLKKEKQLRMEIGELEKSISVSKTNAAVQEKFAQQQSFAALTAELDLEAQVAKELERIAKLEKLAGAEAANRAKQALEAQIKQAEGYKLRAEQIELENKLGRSLTPIEERRLELQAQYGKSIPAIVAQEAKRLDIAEEQSKALKVLADAETAASKAADEDIKTAQERAKTTEEQVRAIEEETARVGLSTEALNALEIAKINDTIATRQRQIANAGSIEDNAALISGYLQEIEQLERLRDAKMGLFRAQDADKAIQEQKRIAQALEDDLIDAFEGAFVKGGDFAESFSRSVEAQFAKMVLRPVIEAVIRGNNPIEAISGNSGALSSLQAFSAFSQGGNSGLALSQGLKFLESGLASFSQTAYAFTTTGQQILSLGNSLGKIAPYAGSIASLIQGDVKGAAGSALGTYIGGAIAGPIGAAIGGALGGLVGGSKKISATSLNPADLKPITDATQQGFDSLLKMLGGTGSASFNIGGNTGRQGQNANFNLSGSVGGNTIFSSSNTAEGQADGLFQLGEIALNDANIADQTTRAIVAALKLSDFADNIDEVIRSLDPLNGSLDDLNKGLQTAQSLANLNEIFKNAEGAFATLSGASAKTINDLLSMTGGIEGLQAGYNNFYEAFFSEQEKTERLTEQVTDAFAAFGRKVPTSSAQLRRLVDGLNLQDQAHQQLFTTILQLTPALDQLFQKRAEEIVLIEDLGKTLEQAFADVFEKIRSERDALMEATLQISGGPRILNPDQIRSGISAAGNLGSLPGLDAIKAADQQVQSLTQSLDTVSASLLSSENELSTQVAIATEAVRLFNQNNRVGSAFASNFSGGLSTASFDEATLRAALDYAYITYNVGDEASVVALRNQLNDVTKFSALMGESIVGAITSANSNIAAALGTVATNKASLSSLEQRLEDAEKARSDAQQEFSDQLQKFVIDAGKAVNQLGRLREETVRYFQEQQRLASVLMSSSQGLRQTVADVRFNDLTPQEQLQNLQSQFTSLFSGAQGLEGDALAAAGNDLNALINPILQKASEIFASGQQFQDIKTAILAQAESVASRIESLTPVDYQQESLALLDTIDTTLALIEANTASAEQLIVDAIGAGADRTVGALSEIYRGITGDDIPAFAKGGYVSGAGTGTSDSITARLSNGEYVMPASTVNRFGVPMMNAIRAGQMPMGGGDNREMVAELRALRQEVAASGNINLKVVTPDGKVVMQQTIKEIKERSRKGELIVYADGVQ